jgi:hypothetical protein
VTVLLQNTYSFKPSKNNDITFRERINRRLQAKDLQSLATQAKLLLIFGYDFIFYVFSINFINFKTPRAEKIHLKLEISYEV